LSTVTTTRTGQTVRCVTETDKSNTKQGGDSQTLTSLGMESVGDLVHAKIKLGRSEGLLFMRWVKEVVFPKLKFVDDTVLLKNTVVLENCYIQLGYRTILERMQRRDDIIWAMKYAIVQKRYYIKERLKKLVQRQKHGKWN
jgi:hypothetical protein